jgi:ribosomal protein L7/L12
MWPFRRSPTELLSQQRAQLGHSQRTIAALDERSADGGASAVMLEAVRSKKIPVIRVIRAETPLGLKESKELADRGGVVADGLTVAGADRLVALLVDAGGAARRVDAPKA